MVVSPDQTAAAQVQVRKILSVAALVPLTANGFRLDVLVRTRNLHCVALAIEFADGKGIGGRELPAPQAGLFASIAEGFSGKTELPWDMVGYGAALGVLILIIDEVLKRSGSKFRAYLMPIAVGMYLPFGLATPILIGGLIAWFYTRGKPEKEHESILHRGVLFASGVIAGEALTAVGIAAFAAFGMKALDLGQTPATTNVLSIIAAILAVVVFVVMSRPKK